MKEIDGKLSRLKNEEIPFGLYQEFKAGFENERLKLEKEAGKAENGASNLEKCLDFALQYSMKLTSVWASAKYVEKQRLQFLLFPEGIFYNRKKDECRTKIVNSAFLCIADLAGLSEDKKNCASEENSESANWVQLPCMKSNNFIKDLREIEAYIRVLESTI